MNFSPNVKRLLVIIALSVIVIFISKSLLTKAAKNLSVEAERKRLAKSIKETPTLPIAATEIEPSSAAYPAESLNTSAISAESAPIAQ